MEKTQTKFEAQIAASDIKIKEARAAILMQSVKGEADDLVRSISKEIQRIKINILNLTDLAPESSMSLRPGGKDFNAKKWIKDLHEATLDLELKEMELATAEKLVKEWF